MGIFEAVVQGIVQGLTEFLPVSSSGHLLISQHILGVRNNNLFFNVMLHIGTLIAVLAVYWKDVWNLILAFFGIIKKFFRKEFNFKEINYYEQMVLTIIVGLLPLFLLFLPMPGSDGMSVKDVAQELSSEKNILIVGFALIFTGLLMNKGVKSKKVLKIGKSSENLETFEGRERITFKDAISIGIMQLIAAIFPGISRSGSTLSVGLMRGVSKKSALDYSFILGIPAIVAAAALEFKEVIEQNSVSSTDISPIIIGVTVSGIVGFLSIKLFKWLLKTDKMIIFIVYTLIVGTALVFIGILEQILGINIFTGFSI